ncbi:hypothetical protein K440DRAFT_106075 [Wilcoxina mikolae CBS 423.85]|nr:hypothetical protein K440DRAFT_106075 [Wilcoxina mikolae CBS 423.85]
MAARLRNNPMAGGDGHAPAHHTPSFNLLRPATCFHPCTHHPPLTFSVSCTTPPLRARRTKTHFTSSRDPQSSSTSAFTNADKWKVYVSHHKDGAPDFQLHSGLSAACLVGKRPPCSVLSLAENESIGP